MGISDGHLTGVAPGTVQERERRIVEFEQAPRLHQSRCTRTGQPVLENRQRWKVCVAPLGLGLAARCSDVPTIPLGRGMVDLRPWPVGQREQVVFFGFFTPQTGHHARCPVFLRTTRHPRARSCGPLPEVDANDIGRHDGGSVVRLNNFSRNDGRFGHDVLQRHRCTSSKPAAAVVFN